MNACIAIERATVTIQGTSFNRQKSKRLTKWIILILLLLIITTSIHDPIHRHLLNENNTDEQRIWCIIRYSTTLRTYNTITLLFHSFVPLCTNIISALIIIILTARQRNTIQHHQTFEKLLREQFQQHIHLILTPFLLVTLALPRIIIAFLGGCMESSSGPWLFLIGYYFTYVPSMLTFLIFVLPSETYKQVFRKTIEQYRQTLNTRIRFHT